MQKTRDFGVMPRHEVAVIFLTENINNNELLFVFIFHKPFRTTKHLPLLVIFEFKKNEKVKVKFYKYGFLFFLK